MSRCLCTLLSFTAIVGGAASAGDLASDRSSGQTTMAVWVDADGHAIRIELRKSCGRRDCDDAAVTTAKSKRFAPAEDGADRKEPRILAVGCDGTETTKFANPSVNSDAMR
jgi:TonB family protein